MKDYPLEIVALYDQDGDFDCWITKGHHDAAAFLTTARAREESGLDESATPRVLHEYRRWAWMMWDGERRQYWDTVIGPARGAFPVTVLYGQ